MVRGVERAGLLLVVEAEGCQVKLVARQHRISESSSPAVASLFLICSDEIVSVRP
jgi:hypothetical protein